MNLKSVVRGVGVGTAVGTACYLLSKATSRQKHDIRKNANKAMKHSRKTFDRFFIEVIFINY